MRILITDDEALVLEDSKYIIESVVGEAEIVTAENYLQVKEAAKERIDIAFLDIEMPDKTGLEIAQELLELQPDINIIFLTAYEKYALESYKLQASDYLVKPILPEDVSCAMDSLRHPIEDNKKQIKMICFERFSVFVDGQPITFKREKVKEILAYLVAKHGVTSGCTELCDAFWPEDGDGKIRYLWKLISELRKDLRNAGIEEIFLDQKDNYAVDITKFSCDYYEYLEQKTKWNGMFMEQYAGWTEIYRGKLFFENET